MDLSDYRNAIRVAASEVGIFRSVTSVISARLRWGIGPRYHSVFRLFSVPKSDWPSYIDSNESNKITGAINGKENYRLARNKLDFYRHCMDRGIPTVPILGVIGASNVCGVPEIESLSDFKDFLQSSPSDIFFKITDGAHGDGAFSASFCDGQWLINKAGHTPESFYNMVLKNLTPHSAYLIQPVIKPGKLLSPLMPNGALGTVRVITYLEGGTATPILPLLRIPANQNVTDNFSLGLSGNLVAPIDMETGVLGVAKGSRCLVWPSIVDLVDHPDTQQRIAGRTLPYWKETLELVVKAQEKTPELPTLGWDIAITDDGPLVVEANTLFATEIHEVAYERGIRHDLAPIAALLE